MTIRIHGSAALALALTLAACGDDSQQNPGSGGSPAQGGGGSSSSSAGGDGGDGGSASESGGSGGGGGGAPTTCLDASEHEDVFTIEDPALCLVAKYTAPFAQGFTIVPTWGGHGGPLTMVQSTSPEDEVTLFRWQPPNGATGALAENTVGPIDLSISQSGLFMNPPAVDLPGGNRTVLGWSVFGGSGGEAIVLSGDTVEGRAFGAGFYQVVGVHKGNDDRLIHTALTALGDAGGTQVAGAYFADLDDNADLTDANLLAGYGDASGAVARDGDGNVFVTLLDIGGGDQQLVGFGDETVEPGEPANDGDLLATLEGSSGTALAALSPDDGDGWLFFQPLDGTTFAYEDVVALRYGSDGNTVSATTALEPILTMATAGTAANLMSDDQERLWIAIDTGASETTFFVVAPLP